MVADVVVLATPPLKFATQIVAAVVESAGLIISERKSLEHSRTSASVHSPCPRFAQRPLRKISLLQLVGQLVLFATDDLSELGRGEEGRFLLRRGASIVVRTLSRTAVSRPSISLISSRPIVGGSGLFSMGAWMLPLEVLQVFAHSTNVGHLF